jgi:hypothetical protein
MFITVHSKSWFDQMEWSVGYCPRCRRTEAVRIGRVVSTTSVYAVIRVSRRVGEQLTFCDACGAEAEPYDDALVLDLEDWSYRDGLPRLVEMCTPYHDPEHARYSTGHAIFELLQAVTAATRYTRVDLNNQWFLPLLGATLGASSCLVPALVLQPDDPLRAVFLTLLVGGVAGGLLGVLVGGVRLCERYARSTIENCAYKYHIPRDLLAEIAADFPGRIRRAVDRVV